jgi:hypothetical protein
MMTAISETMSESGKRIVQAITVAREPDWYGTMHLHMALSAMIALRGYEYAKHELKRKLEQITKEQEAWR